VQHRLTAFQVRSAGLMLWYVVFDPDFNAHKRQTTIHCPRPHGVVDVLTKLTLVTMGFAAKLTLGSLCRASWP